MTSPILTPATTFLANATTCLLFASRATQVMCQSRCSTSDPTITKQAPKGEAGVGPSCAFLTNPLLAQPPAFTQLPPRGGQGMLEPPSSVTASHLSALQGIEYASVSGEDEQGEVR